MTDWVEHLKVWLDNHRLEGIGEYCRFVIKEGRKYGAALDAYGIADAANIFYTIGEFPERPSERIQWVKVLQSFQNEETGVFFNETHSDYHTTAHCAAALELFDAKPLYPFRFMDHLLTRKGLESFLDRLNWGGNPWTSSHDGAGCCAAFAVAGGAPREWFDWYFSWLEGEVDPYTGFWRKGFVYDIEKWPGLFGSMAGGFHYHFNYEHFRVSMPYPERVIDTCLLLVKQHKELGRKIGFSEIDWIFCLNRAMRQTDYRREEAVEALWSMCDTMVTFLSDPKTLASRAYDDLHATFGTVCAIAELQRALPGSIRTPKPLKLVLDRRPFI